MSVNTIIAVVFVGVFVGFITGFKLAKREETKPNGTIVLDTRSDAGILYTVQFDESPNRLLNKKKLIFKVKTQ